MGDISSKNCIDTLQASDLMQTQLKGSGKSNIVVMNPEIHLHSNNGGGTSLSTNNDMRIKKLEDELKIKQIEIDLEREMRQLEERERHAENIIANKRLRPKENMIEDQNDLPSWHADIMNEQRACLGEEYVYGQSEKRIRMEHGTTDGAQQTNKKRKKKKVKRPHPANRSFTNNYTNPGAHNNRGQRRRSKTELNFQKDPMELWEWNGTKWVMIMANKVDAQKPVVEQSCSRDGCEPQKQNVESQTGGPLTSVVHEGSTEDALLKDNLLTTKKCDDVPTNRQSATDVPEKAIEVASRNVSIYCLDKTVDHNNKDLDGTYLSQRRVASEITFPPDISISFDEREMAKYLTHDETLFSMPMRTRQSK